MLILALAVAATLGLVRYASAGGQRPRERSIEIIARRYGFEPAVIRVERGDRVRLRFASLDVVHGFSIWHGTRGSKDRAVAPTAEARVHHLA
jgi:heme/copper-type cytochrome/quinol oxidase subunit 2